MNKNIVYLGLTLSMVSLLACSLTPPAGDASDEARIQVAALDTNPLVAGVQPPHEGQALAIHAVTLQFTSSMQPADLERRFVLLPSSFTATSSALPSKLGLTAMCNGRWRVRNPNPTAAVFVWDVYKTTERGSGIVPANTDVFFETTLGQKTTRVFVGGVQHATKAANTSSCTSALPAVPGKVGGFFAWNPEATELSFTPNQPLTVGTTYTVFLGLSNPFATTFTVVDHIPVPDQQPLEAFIDPNLPEEEQADFASVLAQLAPEVRDSVSYLGPDGVVYGTSDEARSSVEVLERVRDNVFQSPRGPLYAYPNARETLLTTANGRPGVRPQSTGTGWRDLADCDPDNDGTGDKSGPYRRVTAPAGSQDARANWMQVSLYLPRASAVRRDATSRSVTDEAGNYQIQTPEGVVTNGPFLYVGGWGSQGRIAVDAGFQLSTGTASVDPNGLWTPFVKAERQTLETTTASGDVVVLKQLSDKPTGKLRGGQVVSLTFFNLDDLLVMVVKGKTAASGEQTQYRVLAMKLADAKKGTAARWRGDGIGNTFKLMTTLAQARNPGGNAQYVAGDGAEGYLRNAAWFSPQIGWMPVRAPRYNANENRWYAEGQYEDYTIRPDPNAPSSDEARPFFSSSAVACEFPNNTTPAKNTVPTLIEGPNGQRQYKPLPIDGARGWLLPNVVQQAPNDNVLNTGTECVSIDLRQPVGLQVSLIPPAITQPWSPPRPTCDPSQVRTQARAVARTQSIQAIRDLPEPETPTVELVTNGEPGSSAEQTLSLRNARGSSFSSGEVTVYPIGSYPRQVNWSGIPEAQRTSVFPVWNAFAPWTTDWGVYSP